jgi:hypothetical protein
MTKRSWVGGVLAAVLVLFATGCSNKGGRAGKVEVVLSERLKQQGVSLEDWRYSESAKSFGVKLKASQPVEKHTYLVISGPDIGRVGSPIPAGTASTSKSGSISGGARPWGIRSATSRRAERSPSMPGEVGPSGRPESDRELRL